LAERGREWEPTLMGYPYKVILCPVDFDDNSTAALGHARQLASDMGATIYLLHVLPILPAYADQVLLDGVDEAAEQEAQRRLEDLAGHKLAGVPVEIHTRITFVSAVPKTILAFARDLGADLIVMATHGRGVIGHLVFGSVTEAVVRNAVCPVLTLRFGLQTEPEPKAVDTLPADDATGASAKKGSRASS
jgi:universal stress protein A